MEGYVRIGNIEPDALGIVLHLFEYHDLGTDTLANADGSVTLWAKREHLELLKNEQELAMEIPVG